MLGDIRQRGLVGDRPEPGDRNFARRVDPQWAEGTMIVGRLLLWREVLDWRVNDDHAFQRGPEPARRPQCDESTHTVPDDHRWPGDPGRDRHGADLLCPLTKVIAVSPAAIPVPGQVESRRPVADR